MKTLPLYASILALLFVALSVRTLRLRQRLKIRIGDAGNREMLRAMRVHSTFAEKVAFTVLLTASVFLLVGHVWSSPL